MTKQIWVTKNYEPINKELFNRLHLSLKQNKLAYYILPNARLVKLAQKRYLNNTSHITYNGGFTSLTVLLQKLLKESELPYTLIDRSMSSVIVAKILLRLLKEEKLKYYNHFNSIEDMAPAILTTIKEIKHYYNNKANQLNTLKEMPLKYHDIMLIYHQYYEELLINNLVDIEQCISLVVSLCKNNKINLKGELLVLAGLQFNKLQIDLVEELIKQFKEVIIVVQANEEQDFFERELSLVSHFCSLGFSRKNKEYNNENIAKLLFSNCKSKCSMPIRAQGYSSKRLETKELVRNIKDLQLNHNISARDIAIVAKRPSEYANLLSYYADKAKINIKTNIANNLAQSMPIKLTLQLLQVHLSNWSADEFLTFITNGYITDINTSLIADFIRITPSSGPLTNWIKACKRQKSLCSIEQFATEDSSILSYEQLEEVESGLLSLKKIYNVIPKQANYHEFTQVLLKLINEFKINDCIMQLKRVVSSSQFSDLIKHWNLFLKLLKQHNQYSYIWPSSMKLNSFFIILKDVIKQQILPLNNQLTDCLELLNPLQIAGSKYKVVYILGFNDGKWPQAGKQSWLQNISHEQLKLPLQAIKDYRKTEKLSFVRVLQSATENINISYLLRNNEEKEILPSQYLIELKQYSSCYKHTKQNTDIVIKNLNLAFNEQEKQLCQVQYKHSTPIININNRILVEQQRYSDEHSTYNGVIKDKNIWLNLKSSFGDNAIYSTTMLEQYGKCPFAFYIQRVLKIKELEQLSVEVNPLIRGNIIHSVLAVFLDSHKHSSLSENKIDIYEQELKELLEKQLSKMKSLLTDEGETWVLIESDRILYLLRLWLRSEIKLQLKTSFLPSDFEYSFKQENAITIKSAKSTLKIEGFIDRIDISDNELVVYDYKSGVAPKLQDIKDGVAFQIPLYTKAATLKYPNKRTIGGGYYQIGGDFNRKSGMWHEDFLASVDLTKRISDKVSENDWLKIAEHVEKIALDYQQKIINGNFKLAPKRPCPSYCPYKNICRMTPLLRAIVEAKRYEIYPESN